MTEISDRLADILSSFAIGVSAETLTSLEDFLRLLYKWNQAFNLSAVRDLDGMVTRHVADSLSIHSLLIGETVLDVGTGGGLPGIPLAITNPGRRFTLLDTNSKKTRFCRQAVLELGLGNVEVAQSRVEDFAPGESPDTIVTRAFSDLPKMMRVTGHLLRPGVRLVAMKGQVQSGEVAEIEAQGYRVRLEPLAVPGLNEQRHAVIVERP